MSETAREFYTHRPLYSAQARARDPRTFGRWVEDDLRLDWADYLHKNEMARRDYDIRTDAQERWDRKKARKAERERSLEV